MEYKKHQNRRLWHLISVPLIYSMIVPLIFLDITLEIYHNICFRLYGLPLVKRSRYIKIDRYKLKYLGWIDKINCTYCGYGNGLINYARTIAAKTEEYWCGIKHEKNEDFMEPDHHQGFINYGDEQEYRKIGIR